MKKSANLFLLVCALVLGGLMAACGGKHDHKHNGEAHEHNGATQDSTEYACPMHPEITGKKGDTCSQCGMALEPVEK
jgi:hypothetical protein